MAKEESCQNSGGVSEDSEVFGGKLFTSDQIEAFERDGFIVVSGLLDEYIDEFSRAGDSYVAGAKKMKSYFSSIEMGMIFQAGAVGNSTITKAFRQIAFDSVLPKAVAELMRLPKSQRVRVLR